MLVDYMIDEQLNELSERFSSRFCSQAAPAPNLPLLTSISSSTKIHQSYVPFPYNQLVGTSNHSLEPPGVSNVVIPGMVLADSNSFQTPSLDAGQYVRAS